MYNRVSVYTVATKASPGAARVSPLTMESSSHRGSAWSHFDLLRENKGAPWSHGGLLWDYRGSPLSHESSFQSHGVAL